MATSENLYGQYTPPAGAGGVYLKLTDKQTVKLRFMGYPVVSSKMWAGADKPSTRYAWVVLNQDTGEAHSFEQGITFFKQIQALSMDPDWGDTSGYDIKVTRNGSDTDTTYSVIPASKSALTKEQLAEVAKINLSALHPDAIPFEDLVRGKEPVRHDVVPTDVSDEEIDLSAVPF